MYSTQWADETGCVTIHVYALMTYTNCFPIADVTVHRMCLSVSERVCSTVGCVYQHLAAPGPLTPETTDILNGMPDLVQLLAHQHAVLMVRYCTCI